MTRDRRARGELSRCVVAVGRRGRAWSAGSATEWYAGAGQELSELPPMSVPRGAARLNFRLSVCVACRCIVCHAPSVWVMCVWLEKRDRKMETLCFQCLFPRYYVTSGSVLASSSPIIKILGG